MKNYMILEEKIYIYIYSTKGGKKLNKLTFFILSSLLLVYLVN